MRYYTMNYFSCYIAIVINIFLPLAQAQPNFTLRPESVTVPLFATAAFTCQGNGDILKWHVQATLLTPAIQQQRSISSTAPGGPGNLSSVLNIVAVPDNDGVEVNCQIISYQPFEQKFSGIVTLEIRGVSSVENIKYIFASAAQASDYSLQVTWSPPVYFSNDIPAESPVSYQVLVTGEDGEMLLDTNTPDINVTVANVTDCDTFNISVTALVGEYNASNNTGYEGLGYNATITTMEDNFLTPNVTIELSCPPLKSNTFLTITSGTEVIDQYRITGTDGVVNDTRALSPSTEYNYTVHVFNLRDKLEYDNSTIISTYQVIGLYINDVYTNGSVSVQCLYEESSTTDGCHVIFTHTVTGKNESFNITGPDIATLPLPSGNYTVSVYDISGGSLYGPALYYPTLVEVVIPSTSTSSSILSESTTPPLQSTVSNTVSPTVTVTNGTETTSSTNGTIDDTNYIVHVVTGIPGGIVLVVLIIFVVCVGITVSRRRRIVFGVRESRSELPLDVQVQLTSFKNRFTAAI